jgi:hypothetical protein
MFFSVLVPVINKHGTGIGTGTGTVHGKFCFKLTVLFLFSGKLLIPSTASTAHRCAVFNQQRKIPVPRYLLRKSCSSC